MGLFSAIGKYAQKKNAEMQKAYETAREEGIEWTINRLRSSSNSISSPTTIGLMKSLSEMASKVDDSALKYYYEEAVDRGNIYACRGLAKVLVERGFLEKGEGNYYRKTENW